MTGVLSEVPTAGEEVGRVRPKSRSGKFFEHPEELEHARESRPVASEIGAIGGDPALDSSVGGPVDFEKQAYSPPRR